MADITTEKSPLLVGGTSSADYKALLAEGLAMREASRSRFARKIEEEEGLLASLHEQLAVIDPVSAARIHPNDPQRLSRALEVYRVSGRSMTELRLQQSAQSTDAAASGTATIAYTVANLAIAPANRQVLHERIKQRFTLMLEQGFIDEVVALRKRK